MKLFINEKFSHSDETNNIFRIAGKGLIIWIKLAFAFELITGLCVASDMNELVSKSKPIYNHILSPSMTLVRVRVCQ